jgi:hypothetical protein
MLLWYFCGIFVKVDEKTNDFETGIGLEKTNKHHSQCGFWPVIGKE